MLIKLTELSGRFFYLDAANVRGVRTELKMPSNKIEGSDKKVVEETQVITYLMTNQGLHTIVVKDLPEEVARAVNAARAGKNLLVD